MVSEWEAAKVFIESESNIALAKIASMFKVICIVGTMPATLLRKSIVSRAVHAEITQKFIWYVVFLSTGYGSKRSVPRSRIGPKPKLSRFRLWSLRDRKKEKVLHCCVVNTRIIVLYTIRSGHYPICLISSPKILPQ